MSNGFSLALFSFLVFLLLRIYLVYGWAFQALTIHALRMKERINDGGFSNEEEVREEWKKLEREVRPEHIVFDLTIWSYKKAFPGY